MLRHQFELFADYHQFYVWDAGTAPDAPVDYSDEDVRSMAKASANVLVINPVRNMTVLVQLEVHPQDPGYDESEWDHVVEASVELPTGKLQVHECTGGPVLDLDVTPGPYQARLLYAGLDTLSEDGLDGDDGYQVVLWPGPLRPLAVVKQWPGRSAG